MAIKKSAEIESEKKPETMVYIGPTLHRKSLVFSSIFKGGIPDYVERLAAKVPDIRRMIVPVADLAAAIKATKEPGTEENRIYNALKMVRFDGDGEVRA